MERRQLTAHRVNEVNESMRIEAMDEPGTAGAHHRYRVLDVTDPMDPRLLGDINFQDGPIAEAGVNGHTHEGLLAIVADRLEGFQKGPYACDENDSALWHINEAQRILQERTKARVARGMEGTHAI